MGNAKPMARTDMTFVVPALLAWWRVSTTLQCYLTFKSSGRLAGPRTRLAWVHGWLRDVVVEPQDPTGKSGCGQRQCHGTGRLATGRPGCYPAAAARRVSLCQSPTVSRSLLVSLCQGWAGWKEGLAVVCVCVLLRSRMYRSRYTCGSCTNKKDAHRLGVAAARPRSQ